MTPAKKPRKAQPKANAGDVTSTVPTVADEPEMITRGMDYVVAMLHDTAGAPRTLTLENAVRQLMQIAPLAKDRVYSTPGFADRTSWLNQCYRDSATAVTAIVFVAEDGMHQQQYDVDFNTESVDVDAVPPQLGKKWARGAILFHAMDNHVVCLPSTAARLPSLRTYLNAQLRTHSILNGTESFQFSAPITKDVAKHIKNVKAIKVQEIGRRDAEHGDGVRINTDAGPFAKLSENIRSAISAAIDGLSASAQLDPTAVRVELTLKIDRTKPSRSAETLQHIAGELYGALGGDPSETKLTIITERDTIRGTIMVQHATREIPRDEKTKLPSLVDTHFAAASWLQDLRGAGLLAAF